MYGTYGVHSKKKTELRPDINAEDACRLSFSLASLQVKQFQVNSKSIVD